MSLSTTVQHPTNIAEPKLARQVLSLAWPVLALQALVILVELSDRFLIGNLPDQEADATRSMLAAQGTAHYVAWFIGSYTVFVTVGATALVARCIGARNWRTALHATHQSLLLAVGVGAVGTVVGLALLRPFVQLIGLTGPSADYATAYLQPMFALLTFRVVEVAGVACLVGAGDTRTGLVVQGGIAVINIALAWTLSRTFGLGFVGVALGTGLSYALGAVAVLAVLAHGRAGLWIRPQFFRPRWSLQERLLRVSIPAAVDSLSVVAGQMWFLHIVNKLGDTAASAHGIAIGWEALGYLSGHAFGVAGMSLVGRALGAGRTYLAARAGWTAFALGSTVMCIMGATFYTFAPQMFWLFCQQPEQRVVIDTGVPVLRLIAFAMPAIASTIIFTSALRGAGDTRVPVLFTWFGFLAVRIPLAYLLTSGPIDMGLYGAWIAMVTDVAVRGAFLAWRFAGGRWKKAVV